MFLRYAGISAPCLGVLGALGGENSPTRAPATRYQNTHGTNLRVARM